MWPWVVGSVAVVGGCCWGVLLWVRSMPPPHEHQYVMPPIRYQDVVIHLRDGTIFYVTLALGPYPPNLHRRPLWIYDVSGAGRELLIDDVSHIVVGPMRTSLSKP